MLAFCLPACVKSLFVLFCFYVLRSMAIAMGVLWDITTECRDPFFFFCFMPFGLEGISVRQRL